MKIASKRDENGICFNPENTRGLYVGTEKLSDEVKDVLRNSRINCTFDENIIQNMWIKYASNIANNLPQAVLGINASLYTDSEHGRFLAEKLWDEVYRVALAKGIDVGEEAVIFTEVPKTSKYSTLQDIEAGRHTEVDMFAGHLIEIAREHQIDVPYVEYTYHAIKALEEKNDGTDYGTVLDQRTDASVWLDYCISKQWDIRSDSDGITYYKKPTKTVVFL